jgi:hypothetical protein
MLQLFGKCYGFLENVTAFWKMLQLFGKCYSFLENVTAFWKMLQLFGSIPRKGYMFPFQVTQI